MSLEISLCSLCVEESKRLSDELSSSRTQLATNPQAYRDGHNGSITRNTNEWFVKNDSLVNATAIRTSPLTLQTALPLVSSIESQKTSCGAGRKAFEDRGTGKREREKSARERKISFSGEIAKPSFSFSGSLSSSYAENRAPSFVPVTFCWCFTRGENQQGAKAVYSKK